MSIIGIKTLPTALGVVFGLAAIVALWLVFMGLEEIFHHREERDL